MSDWTDESIREAFIYDGGEADYYDPINGAKEQRRMLGAIFDQWLTKHDEKVRAGLSEEWEYAWAGDAQATTFYSTREEAEEYMGNPKRFQRRKAGPWIEHEAEEEK